jgi:hypothetical protein
MGLQSGGRFNFGNVGNPDLKVPRKMTLGCSPVNNHKKYYKGKGGSFLQVWFMVSLVSLVSLCMLMVHPYTKSAPTMHYLICCLVCACPYE